MDKNCYRCGDPNPEEPHDSGTFALLLGVLVPLAVLGYLWLSGR